MKLEIPPRAAGHKQHKSIFYTFQTLPVILVLNLYGGSMKNLFPQGIEFSRAGKWFQWVNQADFAENRIRFNSTLVFLRSPGHLTPLFFGIEEFGID